MKKRTRKSQKTNIDPAGQLLAFAEAWRAAASRLDAQTAIKARRQAEPLFKKNPDFRQTPPAGTKKDMHIDWKYFVHFLDPKAQEAYLHAVETNNWPAQWTEFHVI